MDAALFGQCLRVRKSSGEALDEVWRAHERYREARLAAQVAGSATSSDHDAVLKGSTKFDQMTVP